MTDDLRGLLQSAAGPPARPDHTHIRSRGRRLVALRALSVVVIVAVVGVGAISVALGVGGDDLVTPVIVEPPPRPPGEDLEELSEEATEVDPVDRCAPPDLVPTYLPWLADDESVPRPTHVHRGTDEEPNGALVWAQDPDEYHPAGSSETDTVVIASLAAYEPTEHPDLSEIEVRGYPAELIWVGDPGIGPLGLTWMEGPGACAAYSIHLLITTTDGVPDFLELERSFDQAVDADGEDQAMRELEVAIRSEIVRIADSLVAASEAPRDDGVAPDDEEPRDGHVAEEEEEAEDEQVPQDEEPPQEEEASISTPCRDDSARRNAPPADGGQAHLYFPCDGADHEPRPPVFRLDAETMLTGDIAQDATALLRDLLDGPTPPERARDYYGPADGQDISLNSVIFDGELLVVDLHFGESGVDNLNTATASALWHASLQGTLFQFPEVELIELRLDGSCEDYLEHFQASGCEQLHRSGAPWAAD